MSFTSHAAIVKPNAENILKNGFQPNFRIRLYHQGKGSFVGLILDRTASSK